MLFNRHPDIIPRKSEMDRIYAIVSSCRHSELTQVWLDKQVRMFDVDWIKADPTGAAALRHELDEISARLAAIRAEDAELLKQWEQLRSEIAEIEDRLAEEIHSAA